MNSSVFAMYTLHWTLTEQVGTACVIIILCGLYLSLMSSLDLHLTYQFRWSRGLNVDASCVQYQFYVQSPTVATTWNNFNYSKGLERIDQTRTWTYGPVSSLYFLKKYHNLVEHSAWYYLWINWGLGKKICWWIGSKILTFCIQVDMNSYTTLCSVMTKNIMTVPVMNYDKSLLHNNFI